MALICRAANVSESRVVAGEIKALTTSCDLDVFIHLTPISNSSGRGRSGLESVLQNPLEIQA